MSQAAANDQSRQHIDFLDIVRGVAIAMVFAYHSVGAALNRFELPWGGWFRDFHVSSAFLLLSPATLGTLGVAVFFALSGFCIHLSHRPGDTLSRFFTRRFFRIYPPYLAALCLFSFVPLFHFDKPFLWGDFFSHALLVHNLSPEWRHGINGSFWSIALECQLYLLYPLMLWLARSIGWRRCFWALAAVEVGSRALVALMISGGPALPVHLRWLVLDSSPWFYLLSWFCGAYVAEHFRLRQPLPLGRIPLAPLALGTVIAYFIRPLAPFVFLLSALFTAVVIARLLSGGRWPLRAPGVVTEHLRRTGVWSYSLYLIHQPLLGVIHVLAFIHYPKALGHPLIVFGLCLLSWFAIRPLAEIWYRLFELPSIALGKKAIAAFEAIPVPLVTATAPSTK